MTERKTSSEDGVAAADGIGLDLVARISRAYRVAAGSDPDGSGEVGAGDQAGLLIGPWRLIERIGRGGMGEVYRAERADGAYRAEVAVKLLRVGVNAEVLARRFERERQILARLEHPGIVRLIDGGRSEFGLPFLVMELVAGTDLLRHARDRRLDLAARLSLFVSACDAVAYAHRNLIVHRDLKPSNILVDDDGRVRLLDFGIGKLLEDDAADADLITRTELMPMTVAYAAPEQILGEPVTTATDVFALGVLLYELLTGQRPHRREQRSLPALAGALDTEDVTRPSDAVFRRQPGAPADRRLPHLLRGDLDTIVLTALHRETDRRYASAAALAEEVRRYQEGQPIRARPDSTGYRIGKFLRRHRIGVASIAVVIAALVAGITVALWQADRAQVQGQRAEQSYQLLLSLYRDQDPLSRARLEQSRPAQFLSEAAERAGTEMAGDPLQLARTYADLGELLMNLGELDRAEELVEEALRMRRRHLPATHVDIARTWLIESRLSGQRGRHQDAGELADRAANVLAERLGPDHPDSLRARSLQILPWLHAGRGDEAIALASELAERYEHLYGPDHIETAQRHEQLAVVLELSDRLTPALAAIDRAIAGYVAAVGEQHPRLFASMTTRGDLLRRLRDYDGAIAAYEHAADLAGRHLGPDHPVLAGVLARQADMLRRQGRLDEADALLEAAARLAASGDRIDQLAQIWTFRGRIAQAREDWSAAIAHHRQGERYANQAYGPDAAFSLHAGVAVARTLAEAGAAEEAEQTLEPLLARVEALENGRSLEHAVARYTLGRIAMLAGTHTRAIDEYTRYGDIVAAIYGEHSPVAFAAALTRAEALLMRGQPADWDEAERALAAARAHLQSDADPGELSWYELLWLEAELARARGDRAQRQLLLRELADLPESGHAAERRRRDEARSEFDGDPRAGS